VGVPDLGDAPALGFGLTKVFIGIGRVDAGGFTMDHRNCPIGRGGSMTVSISDEAGKLMFWIVLTMDVAWAQFPMG
jgi:hypothetical protein